MPDKTINFKQESGLFAFFRHHLKGDTMQIKENGKTTYIELSEILAYALQDTQTPYELQNSKILQRKLIQYLDPIKNKPVTLNELKEKVKQIKFKNLLSSDTEIKATRKALQTLEELKNSTIKHTFTYNWEVAQQYLRPGDVICCKWDEDSFNPAAAGQKIQFNSRNKPVEREGAQFVHLAIYVGNGFVVECVPSDSGDEIRLLHLNDPRFAMKPDSPFRYVVSRCKDKKIAENAAQVALRFADYCPKTTDFEDNFESSKNGYAYINSGRSVFKGDHFDFWGKRAYRNNYNAFMEKIERNSFYYENKERFYCSQLVGICLQIGEAQKLFGNQKVKSNQSLDRVQMRFDANWLTPQDFRNFQLRSNGFFEDVILIDRPKKEKAPSGHDQKEFELLHQHVDVITNNLHLYNETLGQGCYLVKEFIPDSNVKQYKLKKMSRFQRFFRKPADMEKILYTVTTNFQQASQLPPDQYAYSDGSKTPLAVEVEKFIPPTV